MKKISLLLFAFSLCFFAGCEESDDPTVVPHVSFENDKVFGVEFESSTTGEIKVYTTNTSGSDRTFNLKVVEEGTTLEPAAYTLPTTVTVPANSRVGSFNLSVSDMNLGGGKDLLIAFDGLDGMFTGAPLKLTAKQICSLNEVTLALVLDRYGSETQWEIRQGSDVVASGGPYTDISTNTAQPVKNFTFCLPDGDYTFVITDQYSDGICCTYGVGSYLLKTISGTVLASGGTFGAQMTHNFTLN